MMSRRNIASDNDDDDDIVQPTDASMPCQYMQSLAGYTHERGPNHILLSMCEALRLHHPRVGRANTLSPSTAISAAAASERGGAAVAVTDGLHFTTDDILRSFNVAVSTQHQSARRGAAVLGSSVARSAARSEHTNSLRGSPLQFTPPPMDDASSPPATRRPPPSARRSEPPSVTLTPAARPREATNLDVLSLADISAEVSADGYPADIFAEHQHALYTATLQADAAKSVLQDAIEHGVHQLQAMHSLATERHQLQSNNRALQDDLQAARRTIEGLLREVKHLSAAATAPQAERPAGSTHSLTSFKSAGRRPPMVAQRIDVEKDGEDNIYSVRASRSASRGVGGGVDAVTTDLQFLEYPSTAPLGRGSQCAAVGTWVAQNGTTMAVKKFPYEEKYRAAFEREAAIFKLLDHDHIVPVELICPHGDATDDDVECAGDARIVMKLVEGGGMGAIRRDGTFELAPKRGNDPWSEESVLIMLQQISAALVYLDKRHNCCHCDIKPENILWELRDGGRPWFYLADFGVARVKAISAEATTQRPASLGPAVGTPLKPEPYQSSSSEESRRSNRSNTSLLTAASTPGGSTEFRPNPLTPVQRFPSAAVVVSLPNVDEIPSSASNDALQPVSSMVSVEVALRPQDGRTNALALDHAPSMPPGACAPPPPPPPQPTSSSSSSGSPSQHGGLRGRVEFKTLAFADPRGVTDAAADVWSLTMTAFVILLGSLPFWQASRSHQFLADMGNPAKGFDFSRVKNKTLRLILHNGLVRDPELRWTAAQIHDAAKSELCAIATKEK